MATAARSIGSDAQADFRELARTRSGRASTAFYVALGGEVNAQLSDEHATSVMYSDAIGVMLMTHDRYHDFTKRPIGDARRHSQALPTLSVDNRDEVDATLTRAVAAGGSADPNPAQDRGFMFNRSIEDPDGYVWEIISLCVASPRIPVREPAPHRHAPHSWAATRPVPRAPTLRSLRVTVVRFRPT
jgi:predicted lactoylglutathione lyase